MIADFSFNQRGGAVKLYWLSFVMFFCVAIPHHAAAGTPAAVSASAALEQTAIANEKSLIEAKKKDDGEFFKRTLSSDFSMVGIDGQLLQGEEAAGNLGDAGLVELTAYDLKVVALGDNGAIVTYDAIVREAPEEDQGPPPRYQHFTSVWTKQGDQWKLKFHQTTPEHWGDW
jgi:hypothetical protein